VHDESAARTRQILPVERAGAALEVLLCSGFPTQLILTVVLMTFGLRAKLPDGHLSAAFIFALTLADTALLVGLVVFFLRAHHESMRLTLFRHVSSGRELAFGLLLIPISFIVAATVVKSAQLIDPALHNVARNPLADLARTRGAAIMFAFVVMIAGGVREEIQRGFILLRFQQYLGGGALGLVLFSVLFGIGHLEQGHDVAIAVATLGAFWGIIYLRRRSVVGPMVAHAGFNLAQVIVLVLTSRP
jgi:membrane protease YdiL (CAAX protease family)